MTNKEAFQSRGEAHRRRLGIDGTAGAAQDIRHQPVPDVPFGPWCAVCGLASGAGVHARQVDAVAARLGYVPAAELARVRDELAAANAALANARAVVEAAKAWRAQFEKPDEIKWPRRAALITAVDALGAGSTVTPDPNTGPNAGGETP